MPAYTFSPAPVLVETTGEFAIGATGVLRPTEGGDPVQVYDLNGSPLPSVAVGLKGAHQAFKADIPHGTLDFGSVLLPTISLEALTAALTAQQTAEGMNARVTALEQGSVYGNGRIIATSRSAATADSNNGDLVLVHPNFAG